MKTLKGNTLPELLMVLGILTVLFAIVSVTLLRTQRTSLQGAQVDTFLADLRDQQTKAMSTSSDFGIYLGSTSYTMFKGGTYNASDLNNFTVDLEAGLNFSGITFPSSEVVFDGGSGDIVGWSTSTNDLTINDSTNNRVVNLELNRYGVPLE